MKRLIANAICLLCATATAVFGQGKAEVRFLAESMPDDLGKVVWVANGKTGNEFILATNQLSEAATVPSRVLGLQSVSDKSKLGVVTLPDAGSSFVVLLIPDAVGSFKSVVIDADSRSFQSGDVFLYNHTEKKIAGNLGDNQFELAPDEGKKVRPSGDFSESSYKVAFNVREETGDRVLRTMRWPVLTRSRSYCFFFLNTVRNRIEFRAVEEFVAAGNKR